MNNSGEPARAAAIRQLIAVRAYELWENEGQPHGRDLINWHQAEQEIMSCINAAAVTPNIERPHSSNADQHQPAENNEEPGSC